MPTITLQQIDIQKIKPSATQARQTFDEAALADLAESMKSEGLIQPITVRQSGDGNFELISGERRWRAAKSLGWSTIDAVVQSEVSDQDAAIRGLIENLQREDLNAIERAKGFKQMTAPPFNLSMDEVAGKVGLKDHQVVSRLIALLDLPQEIQYLVSQDTISEAHIRYLRRIQEKTLFISTCQRAAREGWSVKMTEQEVNKLLGKKPKTAKDSAKPVPDPLEDIWPPLTMGAAAVGMAWGVTYGPQKDAGGKGATMPAWHFWFADNGFTPKSRLKQWFQQMVDAMEEGGTGHEARGKGREASEETGDAMPFAPKSSDEFSQMEQEQKNLRLPKNDQEQAELESLAAQGPAAVYAWIYGPNSLMAKQVATMTWAEMEMPDAVTGCRKLVEGLREMQGMVGQVEGK